MKLTRRAVIGSGALALAAPASLRSLGDALVSPAQAQELAWRHGLSLFGDLKYPAGFKNFEYVNPSAPKGGVVRLIGLGTFDNFNAVISGVKGSIAMGILAPLSLVYDTLMTSSFDEVSTEYGLIAEAVQPPGRTFLPGPTACARRPDGMTESRSRPRT